MARTKSSTTTTKVLSSKKKDRHSSGSSKKKDGKKEARRKLSPKIVSKSASFGGIKKPHRFRPGTVALRQIKQFQIDSKDGTKELIPKAVARRVVKDIASIYKSDVRIQASAYDALQIAGEYFLVKIFDRAQEVAILRKHKTVMRDDLLFATDCIFPEYPVKHSKHHYRSLKKIQRSPSASAKKSEKKRKEKVDKRKKKKVKVVEPESSSSSSSSGEEIQEEETSSVAPSSTATVNEGTESV